MADNVVIFQHANTSHHIKHTAFFSTSVTKYLDIQSLLNMRRSISILRFLDIVEGHITIYVRKLFAGGKNIVAGRMWSTPALIDAWIQDDELIEIRQIFYIEVPIEENRHYYQVYVTTLFGFHYTNRLLK
ncbi:hypothetical protein RF11_07194 [Thelohanellus kitauei]|uniref:Uncharacterized protein n=1 Tax=Thelohanellus kitauei TaxID=669202 RepID=A0A0C2I5Q8_THEKT|nr:hypothetical protein RF11_07194 [Thelohanellus kitauei]